MEKDDETNKNFWKRKVRSTYKMEAANISNPQNWPKSRFQPRIINHVINGRKHSQAIRHMERSHHSNTINLVEKYEAMGRSQSIFFLQCSDTTITHYIQTMTKHISEWLINQHSIDRGDLTFQNYGSVLVWKGGEPLERISHNDTQSRRHRGALCDRIISRLCNTTCYLERQNVI